MPTHDLRTARDLDERLLHAFAHIPILPRRLRLETPGVEATVPMLRGVWGAALYGLDEGVYRRVFGPNDPAPCGTGAAGHAPPDSRTGPLALRGTSDTSPSMPASRSAPPSSASSHASGRGTGVPGYILRPAPPDPQFAPAAEWILIGAAVQDNCTLCRAWDIASGMGLGKQRRRFHLREILVLLPDGSTTVSSTEWTLDRAALLVARNLPHPRRSATETFARESVTSSAARDYPCRLVFRAPLRIIVRGKLAQQPTWSDLVVAACRRVGAFMPVTKRDSWRELEHEALDVSRHARTSVFEGSRLDLHRYSARQKTELDLQGVQGSLVLYDGPGTLWPLLAAAQWLHLGKGTVMGLGQLEVHPL